MLDMIKKSRKSRKSRKSKIKKTKKNKIIVILDDKQIELLLLFSI
jgi:hypothetical protein